MKCRAFEAGQGAEVDIRTNEQVATVAKTVRPWAGVEVLHRQAPELYVGTHAVQLELFTESGQRPAAGVLGAIRRQTQDAGAEQHRQNAKGFHGKVLVLLLFFLRTSACATQAVPG